MKVLSLFDGMSCGQIALKQLGIIPEVYYASEIDKHAIKQTQLNFPDTIQLGDVTKWKEWDIDWKSIDLVLAGSPTEQRLEPNTSGKTNCLTSVQKDNLILQRSRGNNTGGIFEGKTPPLSASAWEQNNLLCERQRRNYKSQDEKANAFLSTLHKGSQANGMTLVKGIIQLNHAKDSGGVQPYQQDRIYDVNGIAPALCSGHGGMGCNVNTDRIRRLTPTECARLQTIPSWYRWKCSDTQIYKMLGNGWTVDVIVHILSFMKEKLNINVA